jgi:hypothetical protein
MEEKEIFWYKRDMNTVFTIKVQGGDLAADFSSFCASDFRSADPIAP